MISLVVPFYNEAAAIEQFVAALLPVLDSMSELKFEIVCVDDGSRDDTLDKLCALAQADPRFRVIEFSRNFGKEAALTAGINEALGDAVIPIDADLQDPPSLIPALIEEWVKGAEVVLARRKDRSTDSFLKRRSATLFYRLHNRLADLQIPENVGDFRLMDRLVIDALKRLPERQRFMKGLFAWVGFRTTFLDYVREPRVAGRTKFSGWRLWNFALEGFTSFSTLPLKTWTYVGALGAVATLCYAAFIVVRTIERGIDVPGYASLLVAVLFLGSLQLLSIGVLGEYVGRIYMEAKQRPTYVIRKTYTHGGRLDSSRAAADQR